MNKLLLMRILLITAVFAFLLVSQVFANPLWPNWPGIIWGGGGGGLGQLGRSVCMQ